ncbi:YkgJ family cysteine cluster protein [Desulforudis sp. DRI-14]
MLPAAKIYEALAVAENNRLFAYLEEIYERVPEADCQRCGTCCADPPPAGLIEYLNVYRYVRDNLKDLHPELVERAVRFFFLHLVDPDAKCPFLGTDSRCLIYPVRPLNCRLYGHLDRKAHEELNSRGMEDVGEYYRKTHGITLPKEILESRIPYCEDIKSKGHLKLEQAQEMTMGVLALDAQILPSRLVFDQVVYAPLGTHLACSVLNEGVQKKRPEVMKEYLETGASPLMEKYLERAGKFNF